MNKLLILLLSVFLINCSTQKGYVEILDTWIGATEEELVQKWGVPSGQYNKSDGGKLLSFSSNRTIVLPGSSSTYGTISPLGTLNLNTYGTPATPIGLYCETTFDISSSGVILGYSFKGNDCYA